MCYDGKWKDNLSVNSKTNHVIKTSFELLIPFKHKINIEKRDAIISSVTSIYHK